MYKIRAYCSDCKKLLMESVDMSRKELKNSWDIAVIQALGIPCASCGYKAPNAHLDLAIYHKHLKKEFTPKELFPNPKNPLKI